MVRPVTRRFQGNVPGFLSLKRRLKTAIDVLQNVAAGTKVRRYAQNVPGKLPLDGFACQAIGRNIGATEAVDGLLGITNHE